jgi:hypothetical protein
MKAASVAAFDAKRVAQQWTLWAKAIKLNGTAGTGIYTAPRMERVLRQDGGGFNVVHLSTLTLRKADWPAYTLPLHFEKVTVELLLNEAWATFKVGETKDVHLGSEWKLELEALVS